MRKPLVVIGAGGFGREALDVLEAINAAPGGPHFELLGVLDSSASRVNIERLSNRGVSILGSPVEWIAEGGRANFVVAIGEPAARKRVAETMSAAGLAAATLVHPASNVGSRVKIGAGSIICAGVAVSTNVVVGLHVHLNPNSTIGHDTVLGDFVSVNPAATVSGEITIGPQVLVGAGAVILQGLEIGDSAVVGAAACVVRNVPAGTTVKGVPAR